MLYPLSSFITAIPSLPVMYVPVGSFSPCLQRTMSPERKSPLNGNPPCVPDKCIDRLFNAHCTPSALCRSSSSLFLLHSSAHPGREDGRTPCCFSPLDALFDIKRIHDICLRKGPSQGVETRRYWLPLHPGLPVKASVLDRSSDDTVGSPEWKAAFPDQHIGKIRCR